MARAVTVSMPAALVRVAARSPDQPVTVVPARISAPALAAAAA